MGTHCRLYLVTISLLLATVLQQVFSSGFFELKLLRLCSTGECAGGAVDSFRVCVRNYQAYVDPFSPCIIGEDLLPAARLQSDNPIGFYFNFTWLGSFSLIIEAYKSDPSGGRTLLSRFTAQRHLSAGTEFVLDTLIATGSSMKLELSYRVRCEDHYFDSKCDTLCKSRDDKFGHYTCRHSDGARLCISGWTGEYCSEAVCILGCHSEYGQCQEPNKCDCRQGWEGVRCDVCKTYPGCVHGTCTEPWQCICNEGWGGLFCDQDLNYCTNHRPCKNGGTCTNTGHGSYTCSCSEEYMGKDCDVLRNPCKVNPCHNGGICKNPDEGNFTCTCPLGFYGPRCETSASICTNNPCKNGGFCVHDPGGFACSCPEGYYGAHCEKATPKCTSGFCHNGGTCVEHPSGHYCQCTIGFQGAHCEIVSSCVHYVCLNGGTCYELKNSVQCACVAGYLGSQCEININECVTKPCKNGGVCYDGVNDYECICKPGFSGKNCTIIMDQCSSSPCHNGASCQNLPNQTFLCHCLKEYSGNLCQFNRVHVDSTTDSKEKNIQKASVPLLGQIDNPSAISNVSHHVSDEPELPSDGQTLTIVLSIAFPLLSLFVCAIAVFLKWRHSHVEPKPKECEDFEEEDEQKQNERNALNMNNKCTPPQKIVNTLDRAPAKVPNEGPVKILNTEVSKLQEKKLMCIQRTLDRVDQSSGYKNDNHKSPQRWSGCPSGNIYVIEDHYRSHSSICDVVSNDRFQSRPPSLSLSLTIQDEDVLATEV